MSSLLGGKPGAQARLGGGLSAVNPSFDVDPTPTAIYRPASCASMEPLGTFLGKFRRAVIGVTMDKNNALLASCVCHLHLTATDKKIDTTTSDAAGNYEMSSYADGAMYVASYKAGAPDLAGVTVNTLTGA